jgi:hypothetical protein
MPIYPERKYHNKPTDADGYTFASRSEHRRYQQLRLLEYAGAISDLVVHPPYTIKVNGVVICKYIADFSYVDRGQSVTEDVKSPQTVTAIYKLKKRLMQACFGITVREVYDT